MYKIRAPFEMAFQNIIRAHLREEYHIGMECNSILCLTDTGNWEQPPNCINKMDTRRLNEIEPNATCFERMALAFLTFSAFNNIQFQNLSGIPLAKAESRYGGSAHVKKIAN